MIEDYPIFKKRKYPPLEGSKGEEKSIWDKYDINMSIWETKDFWYDNNPQDNFIKCECGYNTGLNKNGFHMVIPYGGLRCPTCGKIIIQGNNVRL